MARFKYLICSWPRLGRPSSGHPIPLPTTHDLIRPKLYTTTAPRLSQQSPKLQLPASQHAMEPAMEAQDRPADDVFDPRFLVISLGNPVPHADCLHSAGHYALSVLQRLIMPQYGGHEQPLFVKDILGKKAVRISQGPKYTLVQSPTQMNVSGLWVGRAWREFLQKNEQRHPGRHLGLVVVHDDLEEDLCVVKVREWQRSHRGHNGLRSIMTHLPSPPGDARGKNVRKGSPGRQARPAIKWTKIGIGIGPRPEARDPTTVSQYVLQPMSTSQRQQLSSKSAPAVLEALEQIEAAWKAEQAGVAAAPKKGTSQKGRHRDAAGGA